ncbi:MAG: alpha/beta hydrolase [Gemmatimonadaceae bacterium]|nr:alpha/beta hydrolase [Gemmatimonadaceae bacterium]
MTRRILSVIAVLVAAIFGAVAYGAWKNPEVAQLDDATRAVAPGTFVRLAGGMTHYEVAGPDSAQVVVLVHGFSVPMYIWDSTFVALRDAGYRVVRYDLYGRGWSDRPDAAYDGPMYDAQLNGLLDSLGATRPIHLVGLSFGGFVVSHYARGHRRRLSSLTLVDPVSTSPTLPSVMSMRGIGPWLFQSTQVPGMADNQTSDFLHPERYPTWADRYRPQIAFRGFGRSLLRSALTMSRTDFPQLFREVGLSGVPVLLVWGKQDQTTPIAGAEVIRQAIPSLELAVIDSAGHLPHIEQAALVNAKLQNFLRFPAARPQPRP